MLRRTHGRHREVRTVVPASCAACRKSAEPGERPMTRHGQVARTTAPHRRRSTGCYVHIAVAPIVTHTNPVGINATDFCDLARKPLPRHAHRILRGNSRQALAHPEAQIPIGTRLRPAGSCMRDFRTPNGTRNPSASRSLRARMPFPESRRSKRPGWRSWLLHLRIYGIAILWQVS